MGAAMVAIAAGGCKKPEPLNADGCPGERRPHDHTPQHGGQIGMVGELHLEVVDTGTEVRVFFTDVCRLPLPPPEGGQLVLEGDSGAAPPIERALRKGDGFLYAERGEVEIPFLATVKAQVGPHHTEMSFLFFESPDAGP